MSNLQTIKQRFGIIGSSDLLDRALSTAARVAPTDLTVLITGESGVGKEVFSKIIHELSTRKHNKFIAVNCGAIPPGTINSELFGHIKGAFTGATSDRKGYFESVNDGTIFLDEIGDMPLDTQAFLLRVLESGEFLKVGSSQVQKTDVRVVAATNVNLLEKIKNGKFREDLYYRLNTVPIHIPSLKERPEDIPLLFRKFLVDFADKYRTESVQLDKQAYMLLQTYPFPGNIRELKNIAEQLSVLADERAATVETLLDLFPNLQNRNLPVASANGDSKESFAEREILYKLLFEMKADMTDLKRLVYELAKTNDLEMPVGGSKYLPSAPARSYQPKQNFPQGEVYEEEVIQSDFEHDSNGSRPIIINDSNAAQFKTYETVEENLSLEDMEKEMIKKALKKHKGRRKEAADDLGISERTLYRKIKQYELD